MNVPLVPMLRPPLYIETGEYGVLFSQKSCLPIQSFRTSAKGICNFRYLGTGEESACGFAYPYLFSKPDYEWFRGVVLQHGFNPSVLADIARSGVHEVVYLFAWLESLRLRAGKGYAIFESNTQPHLLEKVSVETFLCSFKKTLF